MPPVVLIFLVILVACGIKSSESAGAVNTRVRTCTTDNDLQGYEHLMDLMDDQEDELERLQMGESPNTPYIFNLCPRFGYLIEEQILEILLPNMMIVCGTDGLDAEYCEFQGGSVQVTIPSTFSTSVEISGVRFTNFTDVAIAAYGGTSSNLILENSRFFKFEANSLISQEGSTGSPMSVEVKTAQIYTGNGKKLFENVGGNLHVEGIEMKKDVIADAFISVSDYGSATLKQSNFAESDITRITSATSGSTMIIQDISVKKMNGMRNIFYADGTDTSIGIADTVVEGNSVDDSSDRSGPEKKSFNFASARSGAKVTISNITFIGNTGVDRFISSSIGSDVTAEDVIFDSNTGTSPPDLLSGVFVSEDGSLLKVARASVTNCYSFSSIYFAICSSSIQVIQSCVNSGKTSATAFISGGSDFDSQNNYISSVQEAQECERNEDGWIYKEDSTSSGCFIGKPCSGGCAEGFSEAENCEVESLPELDFDLTLTVPSPGGTGQCSSTETSAPISAPTMAPMATVITGMPTIIDLQAGDTMTEPSASGDDSEPSAPPGASGDDSIESSQSVMFTSPSLTIIISTSLVFFTALIL